MIDIYFYSYNGEKNRLKKALPIGNAFSCNFNAEYNLINPVIKIAQTDDFTYNYCYIPAVKRYYFIDRVVVRRGGYYELYLSLDALMTYKDNILKLYGTVTRSTKFNYCNESSVPIDLRPQFKKYEFEDHFNHDGTYVLITTGYVGS